MCSWAEAGAEGGKEVGVGEGWYKQPATNCQNHFNGRKFWPILCQHGVVKIIIFLKQTYLEKFGVYIV